MPVRRLSEHSPSPRYVTDVTNFAARLRLYNTVRTYATPDVIQVGSLYSDQLDAVKAWLDARYANMLTVIRTIRGSLNTNPVYVIDPIEPPPSWYIGDMVPGSNPPLAIKTSDFHKKPCQAVTTPGGLPKMIQPKGKIPGPILPISPRPRPRPWPRPKPWPPWPPLPLPVPIVNWYPAREEKYSLAYGHYWRFVQGYNDGPATRYDIRSLAYFTINFWVNYYDLYRVVNSEVTAKQLCIDALTTLQDALC